jgi:hypothetical protein
MTSITDASFALLEGLVAIAADPAAARRHIAEVREACQQARAEAEEAQSKAETARAASEAALAKLEKEHRQLDQEREDLRLRRLAYRESERSLRVLQDGAMRARDKERASYIGPAIDANPAGFAPAGSIAARARQDYAEAPEFVRSEVAPQGPPVLPREGLGGRRPQKRPEV